MGAKRVYWAVGLLAIGLTGIGVSFFGDLYWMVADGEGIDNQFDNFGGNFNNLQDDIDEPRVMFHTDLWHEAHVMDEGGRGSTANYEQVPFKAQVLTIFKEFYLIGLIGLGVAVVGLLFRLRGLVDAKGVLASLAVISIAFMAFGFVYFSANIAEAYNKQLEANEGSSPEIAFFTFGTSTEDGDWHNVTSMPGVGWWGGAVGIVAMSGAFGFVYATDLRRARDVLVDDAAAAEHRQKMLDERHVIDRIREGGRS